MVSPSTQFLSISINSGRRNSASLKRLDGIGSPLIIALRFLDFVATGAHA